MSMKITLRYKGCNNDRGTQMVMDKFIHFLQGEYPLNRDMVIEFLGKRNGEMTTGSRTSDSILKILVRGRIIRDVLRTVAHEWVHEYQIGVQGKEKGPNIGGELEDEANALSGKLVKMFERDFPHTDKLNYDSFE